MSYNYNMEAKTHKTNEVKAQEVKMDIQIKNVKEVKELSEETICFTASLYVDNKKVGTVSNRGYGGDNDYHFDQESIYNELNEWCKKNLPKWKFEGEELDTDLDIHIGNLLNKHYNDSVLKRFLNKNIVVKDDTCKGSQTFVYSKKKCGITNDNYMDACKQIMEQFDNTNPVILNLVPYELAYELYYKEAKDERV
jgi:hypothetical protein